LAIGIHIITVGGTIDKVYAPAGAAHGNSDYDVAAPAVIDILARVNPRLEVEVTPLLSKDSLDMRDLDRETLVTAVKASSAQQIVITHGTDTMIKTGQALTAITGKTLVLTGAMRPALFRDSDADFNLGAAVTAAQIMPEGVYLCMNGRIFDIDSVSKNHLKQQFQDS